jgi:hypothetical protein
MERRHVDDGWGGVAGLFGGVVMAAAVDIARLTGFRPQSVTLAFVSTLRAGDLDAVALPVHEGRSSASLRLELHQDGRLRAHGIASMVRIDESPTWEYSDAAPDTVQDTGPDDAPPYVPRHRPLAYLDRLDVRADGPDSLGDGTGAWVRARAGAADGLSPFARLALYLDVLPPGLFATDPQPAFVPSLELTAHFSPRAQQAGRADAWTRVHHRTLWASDSYCVDESVLQDVAGRPVAMQRQGRHVRWNR